ncbi:hypothetical protein [Roseisalinus antarcticus]|uniref:DUF3592 domain-containing protein n=1 Tax=Roseisalinus antarcticus TaxID=254357 RepID=A0A1Y5TT03_9RHOB|nr:hypothetical protein [Roseisalinus antarcticus]SLN71634.1 hypothetical protein ROA7023_03530 [Roseisalinus antarcticus]
MDPHHLARKVGGARGLAGLTLRQRLRIVVFAFPLLCLLAALGLAAASALFQLRSVPVEGTVVARYEWPGTTIFDRRQVNYEPIFTYEIDGEPYRASVGSAHPAFDLAVGETAMIRAIPGDRGNVRMDTWIGMWFIPAIVGLLGAVSLFPALLIWGLVVVLLRRRSSG